MAGNGTGVPPERADTGPDTQDETFAEGSLRALLRKATEFAVNSCRITREIDSYEKNRLYVQLELNNMYKSLTELYARMFIKNWPHFKRVTDLIVLAGTQPHEAARTMAQIYISHWIVDLYQTNKMCVERISNVALNQRFVTDMDSSSYEYDVYLAHLNTCIRPTHVVGLSQDVMYIPQFAQDLRLDEEIFNPFGIEEFFYDRERFSIIINLIRDKRCGWKMTTLTNDTVGRPVWLFDWHTEARVCAWFPLEGNYNSEDVMYAFILGVACTPKLAQHDSEPGIPVPEDVEERHYPDFAKTRPEVRHFVADYEVMTLHQTTEKFYIQDLDDTPEKERRSRKKRKLYARTEPESSAPSQPSQRVDRMETEDEKGVVKQVLLERRHYLYYARVIFNIDISVRLQALQGLLEDATAFKVY